MYSLFWKLIVDAQCQIHLINLIITEKLNIILNIILKTDCVHIFLKDNVNVEIVSEIISECLALSFRGDYA